MKLASVTLAVFAATAAVAETAETKTVERGHKMPAPVVEMNMRRHGGFLERPGSFEGKFVIIDERTSPDTEQLFKAVETVVKQQRYNFVVLAGKEKGEKCLKKKLAALGANVGVFVVEDDVAPSLVIAPEEGWAVVNVKPLVKGVEKSRLAPARIRKEVLRAIGFVAGGMSTRYATSLAGAVTKPDDLDKYDLQLPLDVIGSFKDNLAAFGVTPYQRTTYREACKQGWAPAPTNDYQKVVWTEYHTKPTEPMKIKFDPKKGE